MYTVYVIEDDRRRRYKGLTNKLPRRLVEHYKGKTKTTRRMKGIRLVYKEEYLTFIQAKKREKYLKSAAGRRYLKKILGS